MPTTVRSFTLNAVEMSCSKFAAAVIVLDELGVFKKRKQKKRSEWTKQWLRDREKWSHINLLNHLRVNNVKDYQNFLRMTEVEFNYLLEILTPRISKQDTHMRKSISAEHRLIATLRYLATGRKMEDLKFSCAISPQALGKIIPETCRAIYSSIKDDFIKVSKAN